LFQWTICASIHSRSDILRILTPPAMQPINNMVGAFAVLIRKWLCLYCLKDQDMARFLKAVFVQSCLCLYCSKGPKMVWFSFCAMEHGLCFKAFNSMSDLGLRVMKKPLPLFPTDSQMPCVPWFPKL
jgi:hypothetical protein